jgi:hypothetical protein
MSEQQRQQKIAEANRLAVLGEQIDALMQQLVDGISEMQTAGLLTGREYSAVWNALPQGTMAEAAQLLRQFAADTANPPNNDEWLDRILGKW